MLNQGPTFPLTIADGRLVVLNLVLAKSAPLTDDPTGLNGTVEYRIFLSPIATMASTNTSRETHRVAFWALFRIISVSYFTAGTVLLTKIPTEQTGVYIRPPTSNCFLFSPMEYEGIKMKTCRTRLFATNPINRAIKSVL